MLTELYAANLLLVVVVFFFFFLSFLSSSSPSRRRPFTAHSNREVRPAPLDRLLLRPFVCTNNLTTLLEMLQLHLKTIQMTTECRALTPPRPPPANKTHGISPEGPPHPLLGGWWGGGHVLHPPSPLRSIWPRTLISAFEEG